MKVSELFEERAPKLSKAALEALPEPSAKNMTDRYKVGKVAFDNVKGLGAVPNNQEVDYFGFAAEMAPADFLRLAGPGDRSEKASELAKLIDDGSPLGAPFLNIAVNLKEFEQGKPLEVKVVGHEGRARMMAIHGANGGSKIPVHMFIKQSLRAHDLNEAFFKALRETGIIPEKLDVRPMKVHLGKIFWMGKTL